MKFIEAIDKSSFSSARLVRPDGSGIYVDRTGTPFYEVSALVGGEPVLPVLAEYETLEEVLEGLSPEARQSDGWQPLDEEDEEE